MEIDISKFFAHAQGCARDYSASQAELGPSAGADTWRAACDDVTDWPLLDSAEKLQAMREFVRSSGGWDDEEVAAMSDAHLGALLLQWVAGDMRVAGLSCASPDWAEYEQHANNGQCSGNIFRADDGMVCFYLGE